MKTLCHTHLFWVVIDKLTVDKTAWLVGKNAIDLFLHLLLLSLFDLCDLGGTLNAHATAEDFHLVCIHGSIGNEHAGVFNASGLIHADFLVQ